MMVLGIFLILGSCSLEEDLDPKDSKTGVFVAKVALNNLTRSMINYHNKTFRPIRNSENGETSHETVFHYQQIGNILTSTYVGGKIRSGHLIGLVDESGRIDMRYHQINDRGELMTGICKSRPEILDSGKIRLHETWEWTSGDRSKGTSIIEEQ